MKHIKKELLKNIEHKKYENILVKW